MSAATFRLPGDTTELPEVDVAIVMESTYPFLKGGVSAVVHDIITNNPDLTFGIIHIAWDSKAPSADLYGVPSNVAWIDVLYLSLSEFKEEFAEAVGADRSGDEAARRLIDAVFALHSGSAKEMWALYDEALNPLTRTWRPWAALPSKTLMHALLGTLREDDPTSVGELFWMSRDFFSLTYALVDKVFPKARVYHAHTTGYASLVVAAAARQHQRSFLLTEHNLYVRDTVNTLLERRMDLPVTHNSWQDLPRTTFEKAWTYWWCQLAKLVYPYADHITYLYPAAVREARGLAMQHEHPEVLPNGLQWDAFQPAREARKETLQEILAGEHRTWRFACIARVVPIKGIMDLIDIAGELRRRGHSNFTIDVLGPTEHVPEYYEECVAHAQEQGLAGVVTFRGTVQVREELQRYDALLLTSYNEGQPIVVLEAMAAGLPIVGTDVGGMDMTVTLPLAAPDGRELGPSGALVKAGDIDEFADAVERLMGSAELYGAWHQAAYDRLQASFLMPKIMSRYNQIYRELGARGRQAADDGDNHAAEPTVQLGKTTSASASTSEEATTVTIDNELYPGRLRALISSYGARRQRSK